MNKTKTYICIDLKSFYASVECKERNLDPLTTNLVVADETRTDKTVCLAISPSLKSYGLGGRDRLYLVKQKVKQINIERKEKINGKNFIGKSSNYTELNKNPYLELDFIIARPRMAYYMTYSTNIYNTYLKYVSPDDIFPYSIDEVFCDITNYLETNKTTPEEFVTKMIKDVYDNTGITATAGIGTNMYLAKVAMDVVAKHSRANEFGVRLATLNEITYREKLWDHKPITDIWRVGHGIAKKLETYGLYTMGDVAKQSVEDENIFYKLFGINAELLIDHAWGYEPVTLADVKKYKPRNNSISSGQVLHEPYTSTKAKLITKEMMELLSLELVFRNVLTNNLTLTIDYDVENIKNNKILKNYHGDIVLDRYGRKIPKHSHGTINIDHYTASTKLLCQKIATLYDQIVNHNLLVRRLNISANNLVNKDSSTAKEIHKQFTLFGNPEEQEDSLIEKKEELIQKTVLDIKSKYGKNAIIKGMDLLDGATTIDRNKQIGGHHE